MKQVCKDDQPSLDISHKAITSDQSKYDQEIGSNTMSTRQDVPVKNSKLCGFSCGIDLTLARMVQIQTKFPCYMSSL